MNIGKTIADYRKAANMTQSEVAEQLGVTYQAVSKWERDESLPDITMLPKLADLFGISIDALLRGGFEVKSEQEVAAARELIDTVQETDARTDEPIETESEATYRADMDEEPKTDEANDGPLQALSEMLEKLAPLMKPKQLDRAMRKVNKANKKLQKVYPLMRKETLSRLIDTTPLAELDLEEMIVFLSSEQVDLILRKLIQEQEVPKSVDVETLYPFLNSHQRTVLISWLLALDRFDLIEDFMPFANSEQRDKIITEILATGNFEYAESLYPFINK